VTSVLNNHLPNFSSDYIGSVQSFLHKILLFSLMLFLKTHQNTTDSMKYKIHLYIKVNKCNTLSDLAHIWLMV